MEKTEIIIFIVTFSIILAIFLGTLFIFVFQYRKRKLMFENEKKMLALNSIIQGQEAERSRMARDLHDGLGGMLSGIKLNLSAINGNVVIAEQDALLFKSTIHQLDKAISEMRQIAHNMMPEALIKFGLSEALEDFCDGINESNQVRMKYSHLGDASNLGQSTEVILYRIVQELCNNALKHASAKNIFIQLAEQEKCIILTVEDDGVGFDQHPSQARSGAGLKNVQARVEYLKGHLDIQSAAGNGTSINIEIPLDDD